MQCCWEPVLGGSGETFWELGVLAGWVAAPEGSYDNELLPGLCLLPMICRVNEGEKHSWSGYDVGKGSWTILKEVTKRLTGRKGPWVTIPEKRANTNDPFVLFLLTFASVSLYNKGLSASNITQLLWVAIWEGGVLVGREGFRTRLLAGQISSLLWVSTFSFLRIIVFILYSLCFSPAFWLLLTQRFCLHITVVHSGL